MNTPMNGKTVRTEGNIYRILQCKLSGKTLTSVECVFGPEKGQEILDLNKSRSRRAKLLKSYIKQGLVS